MVVGLWSASSCALFRVLFLSGSGKSPAKECKFNCQLPKAGLSSFPFSANKILSSSWPGRVGNVANWFGHGLSTWEVSRGLGANWELLAGQLSGLLFNSKLACSLLRGGVRKKKRAAISVSRLFEAFLWFLEVWAAFLLFRQVAQIPKLIQITKG